MKPPVTPCPRTHPARKIVRGAVSAALVVAAFGFALPRFASYPSVWASIGTMTWPRTLLVAIAAAGSMTAVWIMICSVLPSLRLREAVAVNLGSSVVANTMPAGGALAMGVSWAMLSSWGISTEEYILYTLVSGTWNVFARLGLPVLAVLVLLTAGRPGTGLIAAAVVGLALLAAAVAGISLLIRSESFALRAGGALQRALTVTFRLVRRQASFDIPGSLAGFRSRASTLITVRGWRITAATLACNLTLWLVLLACLRGVGLSQGQVSWQASLAAFASVRLLTVLPITPGGLGITELGLVGILAAGGGHGVSHSTMAQVTAAVLLYRAVTYLVPIPIGVIAWLTWRHAPWLLRARSGTAAPPAPASQTNRAGFPVGSTHPESGLAVPPLPYGAAGRCQDALSSGSSKHARR
jgi:putative heme transporter